MGTMCRSRTMRESRVPTNKSVGNSTRKHSILSKQTSNPRNHQYLHQSPLFYSHTPAQQRGQRMDGRGEGGESISLPA